MDLCELTCINLAELNGVDFIHLDDVIFSLNFCLILFSITDFLRWYRIQRGCHSEQKKNNILEVPIQNCYLFLSWKSVSTSASNSNMLHYSKFFFIINFFISILDLSDEQHDPRCFMVRAWACFYMGLEDTSVWCRETFNYSSSKQQKE